MLFDIDSALKVRNHYKDILIGTPLTQDSKLNISGIFICHKGNVNKAIEILVNKDFNDKYPLIGVTDEKAKDFEIYVYADNGADIFYHELDKNLSEKGIEKTYFTK